MHQGDLQHQLVSSHQLVVQEMTQQHSETVRALEAKLEHSAAQLEAGTASLEEERATRAGEAESSEAIAAALQGRVSELEDALKLESARADKSISEFQMMAAKNDHQEKASMMGQELTKQHLADAKAQGAGEAGACGMAEQAVVTLKEELSQAHEELARQRGDLAALQEQYDEQQGAHKLKDSAAADRNAERMAMEEQVAAAGLQVCRL